MLEAAAVGRPLIASDAGGIPEIFGSDADRLVAAGDGVALARAMTTFLDQRELARAQAMQFRESVRARFQAKRMVASTSDFYRLLTSRRPTSHSHQ